MSEYGYTVSGYLQHGSRSDYPKAHKTRIYLHRLRYEYQQLVLQWTTEHTPLLHEPLSKDIAEFALYYVTGPKSSSRFPMTINNINYWNFYELQVTMLDPHRLVDHALDLITNDTVDHGTVTFLLKHAPEVAARYVKEGRALAMERYTKLRYCDAA